jgi:transcriptional regulator with XRE-family HTH domain
MTRQQRLLVDRIKTYQSTMGLSDAQVARRLGVTRTGWLAIRRGESTPTLRFAQKAARIPEFRDAAIDVLVPPVTAAA